jgi:hypothetical protein
MKAPDFNLPGYEMATTLDNYFIWLRSPYEKDKRGRWPDSQQIRYNFHILIIAMAEHYGWLRDS